MHLAGSSVQMMDTIAPKSILVVEDDPSVAQSLSLLLAIDKHEVEVVGDGKTALVRYKVGSHDLVIADFFMPGMDGLELARLIRADLPQQPIVLVTAFLETVSSSEKARLQHVDALLGKPFSPEQLREAIRAAFPQG
jgi:CheY-like chemotaxis protein